MATRKTRDVESALKRKGFQLKEGGDHAFFTYHRSSDDKKTSVFTKVSWGNKELDNYLISHMARQCRLTREEFLSLIDCPLEREAYEGKLRDKKIDV